MNNEIMREEILTFIEKNSRVDLKELAIIVGTDEVTVANDRQPWKRSGSSAAIIH